MKRILLILTLLAAFWPADAQNRYHRRIPSMPYARVNRNALQFPGGASADFDLFLRKLDSLVVSGRGDVRILHVGGSHVQGGMWTNTLRKNLMSLRYGMDGGRGLVFPYAAAGTNTPLGYQTSYTGTWTSSRCLKPETVMGVTGMTVSTADTSATVRTGSFVPSAAETCAAESSASVRTTAFAGFILLPSAIRGCRRSSYIRPSRKV